MKLRKVALIAALVVSISIPSFAIFKVEGVYTGYAKGNGLGVGFDLPLIPFIPTSIYLTGLGEETISLPSIKIGDTTFSAGNAKFKTLAVELQTKFPLDIAGVNAGGSLLIDWNTVDLLGQSTSIIGNIYLGLFGSYKQNIIPMVDVFVQGGYFFKILDIEKVLKDNNPSVANLIDLSKLDRSGIFYRVGVSIGF
ncbi:MAG: hypothetical protein A2Y40_03040 [Candidatus Margulisbacteria bacterium GWF2_35_9]|nr:MAG: hypothetical protein A2Y40_03040 [Candidatus Margulisbacteria bacterium GWF2_35_9]